MLNSRFDWWQLLNIFQSPWETPAQMQGVLTYGANFIDSLHPMIESAAGHGGVIGTCICHCSPRSITLSDGSTKITANAYADWYYGRTKGGKSSFFVDGLPPNDALPPVGKCSDFPCTAGAAPNFCPRGNNPPAPSPPRPPAPPPPPPPPPSPGPRPSGSCPRHTGKGCAECASAVDGRCPGVWCDQPCIHLSKKVGPNDCQPANWWAIEKAKNPAGIAGIVCSGNATGCTPC